MSNRSKRDSLVRALIGVAILAAVMLADPFGLDNATERHSADVISRITAPFYGGPDHKGRARVAVVEITDRSISRSGEGWPPGRTFYARLLKRVAGGEVKPAVVFFDYAFISKADIDERRIFLKTLRDVTHYGDWKDNPNCQGSVLSKINCISHAGGVPVIVGKIYPPNACLTEVKRLTPDQDDLQLFHVAVAAPLGWEDLTTRFPPVFTKADYTAATPGLTSDLIKSCEDLMSLPALSVDQVNQQIDAADKAETGAHPAAYQWRPLGFDIQGNAPGRTVPAGGFGYDLPPAMAMAYAVCLKDHPLLPASERKAFGQRRPWEKSAWGQLCERLDKARARSAAPSFPQEVYAGPEWGSISDKQNGSLHALLYPGQVRQDAEACSKERPDLATAVRVGWAQLRSGLGDSVAAVAVPCPYHLTIEADDLQNAGAGQLDGVRAMLQGRAVAIGAAQALSNDWISTPLESRRPGVHYHAMMLDNLLEKGTGIRRAPPDLVSGDGPFGWLEIDAGEVLELLCAFLVLLAIELVRADVQRRDGEESPALPSLKRERGQSRLHALQRAYRTYWIDARPDRFRLAKAGGVMTLAILLMGAATAMTVALRWEPLNIVGLLGFTISAVIVEFWDREGWRAAAGVAICAALLAVFPFRRWFGRPTQPPDAAVECNADQSASNAEPAAVGADRLQSPAPSTEPPTAATPSTDQSPPDAALAAPAHPAEPTLSPTEAPATVQPKSKPKPRTPKSRKAKS